MSGALWRHMDKDIAVYGPLNTEELGPSAVTRKLVRALDAVGCERATAVCAGRAEAR